MCPQLMSTCRLHWSAAESARSCLASALRAPLTSGVLPGDIYCDWWAAAPRLQHHAACRQTPLKVVEIGSHPNPKQMLNVNYGLEEDLVANGDDTDDTRRVETSVFELAGQDSSGLLADVTQLLTTNGCNVRSAAVGPCDLWKAV